MGFQFSGNNSNKILTYDDVKVIFRHRLLGWTGRISYTFSGIKDLNTVIDLTR